MIRRRKDDFLPDASDAFAADTAQPVPFDQTGNSELPVDPPPAANGPESELPVEESPLPVADTDQLSDADLGQMTGEEVPVTEPEMNQLVAALNDPMTSPADRQLVQQRLELAARRRLAGV